MLLINPPVAKPCEPPAGIARIAGALQANGIDCTLVDLSQECLLDQLDQQLIPVDTWSRRALKHKDRYLDDLRSLSLYQSPDRYQRAISDLGRILAVIGDTSDCDISFANFNERTKSPLASGDLLKSARCPESNVFYPFFSRRLEIMIQNYNPGSIGVSFSYLSQALTGFAILGFIRKRYPEVQTIAGGGLLTSWMNSPNWNDPFRGLIDHCIKGAGESELLRLYGKERATMLGTFNYDDFNLQHYLSPGLILPYSASAGCYWKKCRFCPDHAEDTAYLAKPVSESIAELKTLISAYNPVLLHLLDNAISPALLKALIDSPPAVPWYGFCRFEKDLESFDFCLSLKKSGCVMLKLGLESGSQQVLDRLHKGIRLDRVEIVLDNLRRAGIATYIYLLFGTPAETESDALKTLDFVKRQSESITFFNLAIFNMPICGPEADGVVDRFSDGDLSLYCDFIHPHGWDRKTVRNFLDKQFRKDPCIREIDRRNPPVFGSNHAPFLVPPDAIS